MIFTSHRRLTKSAESPFRYTATPAGAPTADNGRGLYASTTTPTPSSSSTAPVQTFSNQYRVFAAQQQQAPPRITRAVPAPSTPPPETKKRMRWAPPTWFLFHTLAEKVREDSFPEIRRDLLSIIYTICCNLPCPDCANHARAYMDAVNFDTIQTKDHLRLLLHRFHNEVNKRKGYPEFPLSEVTPKYAAANTVAIIHYFMPFFEDKHYSIRMISDDLFRQRIASQLKAWFNKHIGHFEL